jgi:DNA replication and repair protein RecF
MTKPCASAMRCWKQGRADPAWLDALELRDGLRRAAMALHRVDAVKVMQEAILERPEGAFPKALIDLDGQFENHAANGRSADGYRAGNPRPAAPEPPA